MVHDFEVTLQLLWEGFDLKRDIRKQINVNIVCNVLVLKWYLIPLPRPGEAFVEVICGIFECGFCPFFQIRTKWIPLVNGDAEKGNKYVSALAVGVYGGLRATRPFKLCSRSFATVCTWCVESVLSRKFGLFLGFAKLPVWAPVEGQAS